MSKRGKNINKLKAKNPEQAKLGRIWAEVGCAWKQRDYDRCMLLLKRMQRMTPANPLIHLELGRMHGLTYDYAAAEESFERSHRLAAPGEKTAILSRAAELARDFYDPSMTERLISRAVTAADASPEMLATFAEVCEKQRRSGTAEELVARALDLDPHCGHALLVRALLNRRAGHLEEAETALRPLMSEKMPKKVRVLAGYELAAVLDRQESYDEAMRAYTQTKSLLHDEAMPLIALRRENLRRFRRMVDDLTPEILRRWRDPEDAEQDFQAVHRGIALLGGHPRSGTTLLEQVLDSHEGIVSAEETHQFNDQIARPVTRAHDKDAPLHGIWESVPHDTLCKTRRDYFRRMESCLGAPVGDRVLIDKNPSLTMSIATMIRAFPEMRFLIALRDPRDVVMSCFMQPMFPLQQVNATWLRLETAAEEYAGLMDIWRVLSPMMESPRLEVRYEDMVTDLEGVARKTLDFLDVPWDERVLEFDEHARQKTVRSPTYAEVTRKIFTSSCGRWRNYQKHLEPQLANLETFVKAFGYE